MSENALILNFSNPKDYSPDIEAALLSVSGVEIDGTHIHDGYVTLYVYGSNADEMLEAVRPVLQGKQGKVLGILRYGAEDDAREKEVEL
jgi:hypothetical protein